MVAKAVADSGVNVSFLMAQMVGRRYAAVFGLENDEMNQLRASKPSGPLAVTHRTGRRRNSPGTDRRFDPVWVSRH
jgi:hypothetical protein